MYCIQSCLSDSVSSVCDQCVVLPHVLGLYSLDLCRQQHLSSMCRTVLSAYMHLSTWACVQAVGESACASLCCGGCAASEAVLEVLL